MLVPKHNEPLLRDNVRPANGLYSPMRGEGALPGDVVVIPDTNLYYVADNVIISDLYSVGSLRKEKDKEGSIPFVHGVELAGPKGEKVRFQSCFDNGAMVNGLDEAMYLRSKGR